MRSTRRSARSSTVHASAETAAKQADVAEDVIAGVAVALDYATPDRPQEAPGMTTMARLQEMKSTSALESPAATRVVPFSTSKTTATESAALAALSPESVAAINTVTPPDSIKTVKMLDVVPVVAIPIQSKSVPVAVAVAAESGHQDIVKKEMDTALQQKEESEQKTPTAANGGKTIAIAALVETPGNGIDSQGSGNKSPRGLVSRRGRFISPGRRQQPPVAATAAATTTSAVSSPPRNNNKEAVIEYKTFRSPPRKRDEEVPSLCSSNSGGHLTGVFSSNSVAEKATFAAPAAQKSKQSMMSKLLPPGLSISCDPSMIDSTSPLASHETDERKPAGAKNPPGAIGSQTPPREKTETLKRSPAKSPPGSNFQTLPSMDDAAKVASPGGSFLSQNPPTPSHRTLQGGGSFDEEKKRDPYSRDDNDMDVKPSPRRDRDRFVATPTDFALDYGKGHHVSGSFDTSNVLAWLQSPTANGFFSPGGYGSMLNTPHAASAPRTPRTPTISTSFFFSDVASLPRGDLTPKGESPSKRTQKGISNIICISPLASSKARSGTSTNANTPMNLKDVFASPQEKNPRSLPLLQDTPSNPNKPRVPRRSSSKDPSLDAVHMAERDLMEDEDLSVLLQLASNTPRASERGSGNNAGGGMHVFRSPNGRKDNGGNGGENLPALQLPMIGGRDGDVGASRLPRKSHSREHPEADDFAPPQLGMRSNSSNGSKEIFVGGNTKPGSKPMNDAPIKSENDKNEKRGVSRGPTSNPYPMPPPYPPRHGHGHGGHDYYPMPPGMPPGPNGSMRIVVGGPPPLRVGSKPGGSPPRHPGSHGGSPHAPPPHYHGDPYSGMPYPPPPHGMYSQYPGPPHHMGMGGYPYQSHYPPPPPRHMPMYGAQNPPGGPPKVPIKKAKPQKPPKVGTKRGGSPLLDDKGDNSSAKKQKKTPNGSQQKKKNKSPQLVDRAERQKAAETIQAVNAASGGKNDRAAALAAAILRGVTMRPSGKWQAQLYFAGKSRYIGVFDTREKAALAYEIAREKLKTGGQDAAGSGGLNAKSTENLVNAARKAAFEGVNERAPK